MDLGQRIGDLSPEQRQLLELKLRQQKIDVLQIPITREYRKDVDQIPLSFGQERLWFIHQLEPHNAAYNLIRATKLEGDLKFSALARGINEIICRHEILRTIFRFESTKPVQVILPTLSLTLEQIDLKGLSKDGQEARVKQIIRDESLQSFDLSTGPLLRVKLLELDAEAHVFLLVVHHIVADGTSIQIFIRELAQLYQAFSRGEPSPLPGLSIQYADYANWQRRWFKDGEAELPFKKKQEAFWLKQFNGKIPVLTLPTDYPRPAVQSFAGSTIVFSLGSHEAAILTAMALKENTTLYVVLLSIYTVFLSRLSGQEDVIVGTPVAGRRHPTVQRLIGMFVNTLALRNFPRHERRFIDFLREVVNRTLDAFENQEYRYEDILGKIDIERDTSRNPLFDVMFMFKNVDYAEVNIPGLALRHYEYDSQTSKFDLTLSAWEDQDTLYFSLEYCTALFQETTIRRFTGSFKRIVRSLVEDAGMKISEIEIAAEEEQRKVLYDFNRTDSAYPADKTIQQLLEEQVGRTPDRAALIFEDKQLTYRGLNGKANCLAIRLTARGARPLMVVGIHADRSPELMAAIFAVLKAGCAYLPLDPSHPERRVKYMLTASSVEILLTHNPRLWGDEFDFIDLNEEEDDQGDAANPGKVNSSADPAYVIYTSGTTGVPKGVVIEHRPVSNFIKGMTDLIDFRCRDRILSLTTVSFDIFGLETLVPLAKGAAVVMGNSEEQLDPGAAASVINREKVTIFQVTPSRLQLFFSPNQANPIKELATLRYLLVGGEQFPGRLLAQVRPLVRAKIFNLYGPTETTIWSTARDLSDEAPLDIGRPIANTRIYILDKNLKSVPIGVRGEIYIGGSGVARGYLNSPELTAERFITAPAPPPPPPKPKNPNRKTPGGAGAMGAQRSYRVFGQDRSPGENPGIPHRVGGDRGQTRKP